MNDAGDLLANALKLLNDVPTRARMGEELQQSRLSDQTREVARNRREHCWLKVTA